MTCDKKQVLYNNWQWPAQWLDKKINKNTPKHFPRSNLHQKKVKVTVWWSSAYLIHYSFLNPSKTITSEPYVKQVDKMHQKLQGLQPALVNRMGPILLHDNIWLHTAQPMLQMLNELSYGVLPHPSYSPDLLPTDYHFFKHFYNFLQGISFHNQQEAENSLKGFVDPKACIFMLK